MCLLSCNTENEVNSEEKMTLITVEISGANEIDSLIVYDKTNSWEIITTLYFTKSNTASDTLDINAFKVYQLYKFSNGNQSSFGEIILGNKQHVQMQLEGSKPYKTRSYKGDLNKINNYLSCLNYEEYALGIEIQDGLDDIQLKKIIAKSSAEIDRGAQSLDDSDTIIRYVSNQFDEFISTLKKKNEKYRYKQKLIGQVGTNFTFKDIDSKNVTFESFQGKYIYIDVWATWCKPCKEEYPYLTQLALDYSDNDLAVLSISIDKDFSAWTEYLSKNRLREHQLYTGGDSDFVKFYDIGAIPRFILLDPSGRIVSGDQMRPSNPDLRDFLDELMKKKE